MNLSGAWVVDLSLIITGVVYENVLSRTIVQLVTFSGLGDVSICSATQSTKVRYVGGLLIDCLKGCNDFVVIVTLGNDTILDVYNAFANKVSETFGQAHVLQYRTYGVHDDIHGSFDVIILLRCIGSRGLSLNVSFIKVVLEGGGIEFAICHNDLDIAFCLTLDSCDSIDHALVDFGFVLLSKSKHHIGVVTLDEYKETIISDRCGEGIADINANFDCKLRRLPGRNSGYFGLLTIEHAGFAEHIWYRILDPLHIDNLTEVFNDVTIFRMNQTTMSGVQIGSWFRKRENIRFCDGYCRCDVLRYSGYRIN